MKFSMLFLLASFLFFSSFGQEKVKHPRPNILFAICDDQSFAHTSFAGSPFVKTPAFDKVANEGVYFTNCMAGSPGCAPSRSSIVTGRHHWQNEQAGQHSSAWLKKYVPFIDLIESNGYFTGRVGKGVYPFQYARSEADSLWRKTDAAGIEHSQIFYKDGDEDERFAEGISRTNYFENFKFFIEKKPESVPFFFWYGSYEAHRPFEKNSWKRNGKQLKDAVVPGFLPDNGIIRGDLLDYAIEIEWFDLHLQRMLDYLEEIGELENTIVIVTSDNGMAFPRAKANCFEYGVHMPFAIRYPKSFPGNRIVDNPICFIDIAPTILELTHTSPKGMQPISGESICNILQSKKQGMVNTDKKYAFSGRERHSCSRFNNQGYPQRAIRSKDYLLIWNLHPERWPAGAPQRIKPGTTNDLLPMFGIDEEGVHHSEWAFTDIDASPSKSNIIEQHNNKDMRPYFEWATEKRTEFELYKVSDDPDCLNNLSGIQEYITIESELKVSLFKELRRTNDPRAKTPEDEVFDSYLRYSRMREFPNPNFNDGE